MPDQFSYAGEELALFEKALRWKRYFSSFIIPHTGKEVVEAGAGLGSNTTLLHRGTANTWILLEPDPSMASFLDKKVTAGELPFPCTVVRGVLAAFDNTQQFDTIIYIDVLEHIENDQAEMATAASLLQPGGKLIVLAPAFPFLFSSFDKAIGHYRRYTRKSLQKTIPASLTPLSIRYLDTTGFLLSLANRLLLKQKYPTQKQVNFWDRYCIPVSRIMDRIMFYSFGKTILGIWKKEALLP